jgi:hypothetical protein
MDYMNYQYLFPNSSDNYYLLRPQQCNLFGAAAYNSSYITVGDQIEAIHGSQSFQLTQSTWLKNALPYCRFDRYAFPDYLEVYDDDDSRYSRDLDHRDVQNSVAATSEEATIWVVVWLYYFLSSYYFIHFYKHKVHLIESLKEINRTSTLGFVIEQLLRLWLLPFVWIVPLGLQAPDIGCTSAFAGFITLTSPGSSGSLIIFTLGFWFCFPAWCCGQFFYFLFPTRKTESSVRCFNATVILFLILALFVGGAIFFLLAISYRIDTVQNIFTSIFTLNFSVFSFRLSLQVPIFRAFFLYHVFRLTNFLISIIFLFFEQRGDSSAQIRPTEPHATLENNVEKNSEF